MSKQPVSPEPSVQAGAREWLSQHKVTLAPPTAWPVPTEPVFVRDENHYVSLSVLLTEYAQQVEALRAALDNYGEHLGSCPKYISPIRMSTSAVYAAGAAKCNCGLDAALKAAQEGKQ